MAVTLRLGQHHEPEQHAEPEQDPRELQREIAERRHIASLPQSIRFSASGVWPAAGNLLLVPTPSTPPDGFQFHLISLQVISTAALTTLSSARLDIYIGGLPNIAAPGQAAIAVSAGNLPSVDVGAAWEDTRTSFPGTVSYEEWEKIIRDTNALYFLISGGATGQTYTVKGRYKQEPIPNEGTASWNL